MEVLEQGSPQAPNESSRRLFVAVASALAVVIVLIATAFAGYGWWSEQQSRPKALEVVAVEFLGTSSTLVSDGESGWPGGLGTPDGAVTPAVRVRLSIAGDPQRTTTLMAVPPGPGLVVAPIEPVTLPAAESMAIDLTVSPSDCLAAQVAPRELLLTDQGDVVPLSGDVASALSSLMVDLCSRGGAPPSLALKSALLDVFFNDRALIMTTELESTADRVILTPLDGTALRGLGAQEFASSDEAQSLRLRWLISAGEMTPNTSLTGRVQAYAVVDGVAYPWVLVIPAPRDLEVRTSSGLTPLRGDGVDLAEVSPRGAVASLLPHPKSVSCRSRLGEPSFRSSHIRRASPVGAAVQFRLMVDGMYSPDA